MNWLKAAKCTRKVYRNIVKYVVVQILEHNCSLGREGVHSYVYKGNSSA